MLNHANINGKEAGEVHSPDADIKHRQDPSGAPTIKT